MPIYEYACNECGHEFEFLLRGEEKPSCPSCGKKRLTRMLSVSAAHSARSSAPACPARDACGMSSCCNNMCGEFQN
jgi:putative FmdB family regulatory protein